MDHHHLGLEVQADLPHWVSKVLGELLVLHKEGEGQQVLEVQLGQGELQELEGQGEQLVQRGQGEPQELLEWMVLEKRNMIHLKSPKLSNTKNIAVITLKLEQSGITLAKCLLTMGT